MRRLTAAVLIAVVGASGMAHAAPPPGKKAGRALLTFYWIIDESSSRYRHLKKNDRVRDMHGDVIAHTSRRFLLDLVREGSGWLADGRTVVFEKRIDGESRFRVSNTRYGLSSNGCPLVPFRTIAVDPRFVAIGSKLYIPQLKGTKLPDGTVHDGMFIASDHGHFRGEHVDLFAGAGPRATAPFIRHGNRSRSRVTVYVVGEPERHACAP